MSTGRVYRKLTVEEIDIIRNKEYDFILMEFNLSGFDLSLPSLLEAGLPGCCLTERDYLCCIGGSNLRGTSLRYSNLSGYNLASTDFTGSYLGYANLTRTKLTGAAFTNANLFMSDCTGADFTNADLTDAYLVCANLTRTKLTGTDFKGANLKISKFRDADLRGAKNLAEADLRGADFFKANLAGIDLTNVNLAGAILTDAKLAEEKFNYEETVHISVAKIDGIRGIETVGKEYLDELITKQVMEGLNELQYELYNKYCFHGLDPFESKLLDADHITPDDLYEIIRIGPNGEKVNIGSEPAWFLSVQKELARIIKTDVLNKFLPEFLVAAVKYTTDNKLMLFSGIGERSDGVVRYFYDRGNTSKDISGTIETNLEEQYNVKANVKKIKYYNAKAYKAEIKREYLTETWINIAKIIINPYHEHYKLVLEAARHAYGENKYQERISQLTNFANESIEFAKNEQPTDPTNKTPVNPKQQPVNPRQQPGPG